MLNHLVHIHVGLKKGSVIRFSESITNIFFIILIFMCPYQRTTDLRYKLLQRIKKVKRPNGPSARRNGREEVQKAIIEKTKALLSGL